MSKYNLQGRIYPRICFSPDLEGSGTAAETQTPISGDEPMAGDDDIARLLQFDPFPGGEASQATEAAPAPVTAPEGGTTEQGQVETPAAAQTPEPGKEPTKPAEEVSEVALLKKTIEELQAKINAPPQQTPSPTQPQGKEDPSAPTIPEYNYVVPDQLMAGLASEDLTERKQAIGALCQGVSQTVHKQVLDQVAQVFNNTVPQMIMQTIETRRVSEDVKQDFYGKYPELNNPQFYSFIQQQALTLMQETGQASWSPQFRDALAARCKQVLNVAPRVPTPQPAPVQPQTPAMFGGTARPTSNTLPEDDIANTLFG